MKILLVNPYIYDFTAFDLWLRPLGLLYIAGVLKEYTDAELFWLDTLDRFQEHSFPNNETVTKHSKISGQGKYHRVPVDRPEIYKSIPRMYSRYGIPFDSFLEKLENIPDVDMILMTSLMSYWIDGVRVTMETLQKRFPNAKIILGGILPTLVENNRLYELLGDSISNLKRTVQFIRGYGENQILDLLESEGVKINPHPDFSNIDLLPTPAFEFLENREILPLMTSRGCPFHCTYCASDILNPRFAERSCDKIYEEMVRLHEAYGTKHFIIFDDALLVNKRNRFLKLFSKIKSSMKVNFHTPNGLHTREIDRETADLMFDVGFKMIRLSFESTKDEILTKSSNKVSVKEMVRAVENLEAAGYNRNDIDVYLLFGFPGQRIDEIKAALEFVKSLGVTPHLSVYSPVPGTQDFIDLQKSGVLATPLDLYETNKTFFLYNKSGFSTSEIKELKDFSNSINAK